MNKKVFIAMLLVTLSGCNIFSRTNQNTGNTFSSEQDNSSQITLPQIPEGAQVYEISPSDSTVAWKGTVAETHTVGTVGIETGKLWLDTDQNISGFVVLDMSTLDTPDGAIVVDELKSSNFFDISTYPVTTLIITQATPENITPPDSGTYQVQADLTIKKTTRPITFEAEVTNNSNQLSIITNFSISRDDWGLSFEAPTFIEEAEDFVIADNIDYVISLIANPADID